MKAELSELHDVVVTQIANMLSRKHPGWHAYTNHGGEQAISVEGTLPDVVLVDDQGAIRAVFSPGGSCSSLDSRLER